MQQLKSIELIYLNKNVLKSLTQNRITTIKDFLHEDPEKIALLTKLTFAQVLEIRNDIYKKFSAVLITGEKLLEKIIRNKKLCIGIKSLDEILDGGIPVGITEFCGLAESGKTQLCFQIAINCVKNSENNVLYIDTKGDFSALRIQKILDTNGFSHKDMALVLTKIKVIRIWSMEELIELLKKIKNKQCCIEKLALIIIDSLPCLMFQHLGDSNKLGLTYLNTMVNYSRYLYNEFNLSIICVNIQTRWIDQDVSDLEDDGEISSILKEPGFVEKRNRCLGKYWKHIPTTVVLLEKSQMSTVDNTSDLNVTVIKCCNIECDRYCTLKLGDFGVT
ncbi:DNA repair protein RAD51 homolog 4 isoform X1 [Galleria mellonella]|uniref:DNA repair protein RAD51 homolog 4 isoform X1 n=1 Tax=Galleria mellonella TaxID=7137 RepID=A0A6J1WYL5_GALME|nr:DNA repair protein RAD51 homolog 4 isoform X1 [Galleria mellonella]XP_052757547.1 DNA repair protein RAD51 homolog 4 isoform X1 [Galleria mellonella]